jgi:hypothetical protein
MIGGKIKLSEIDSRLFPLAVFSRESGWFSRLIQWRTSPLFDNNAQDLLSVNHAMFLINYTTLASMEPDGFKLVPVDSYLKRGAYLEFWGNYALSQGEQACITADILSRIGKEKYDWKAIVGATFSLRWFQNSRQYDCSELVMDIIANPWDIEKYTNITPNQLRQELLDMCGASIQRIGYIIGKR